jgi:hypothetical protein
VARSPVVASIFRTPAVLTFIDADNRELGQIADAEFVPRVGENVRLGRVPYVVERVGYDVPDKTVERIWVVCRPA